MKFKRLKKITNELARQTFMPLYIKMRRTLIRLARWMLHHNINENYFFLLDMLLCILGLNFVALENYITALVCLISYRLIRLVSVLMFRLKNQAQSFFTGISDYITFALYIFGFALANPAQNALGACLLLAAFVISGSTIIHYSSATCMFGRFNCQNLRQYLGLGLSKDNEIFYLLLIMCILPIYFLQISIFFGLLSLMKSLLMFSLAFYDLEIKNKKFKESNE